MALTTEVIVCTYNGAPFIGEQLLSILKQTMPVDRISIYDDGSSDDTVVCIREVVGSLPAHQQRLFAVHVNAENLGYAGNFVQAIANSTEDVLFLCDQDDLWEERKVEVLLELVAEFGADMVFSDGRVIDESGAFVGLDTVLAAYGLTPEKARKFHERSFECLLKRNYINGAAAAVRRSAGQSALPLPCDMPHDYWLAIWCALHGGIAATAEPLYRYRLHGRNVIGLSSSNLLYQWLGIWRQPHAPRERELRIWKAVTDRIATCARADELAMAQRKLTWLTKVVPAEKKSLARSLEILKSAFNGSYRSYSAGPSFLRDIVSLIR